MKKLTFALLIALGTTSITFAQQAEKVAETETQVVKAEFAETAVPAKKEITMDEVPAPVQKAFVKESAGKELKSIYKVTNEKTNAVSYEFVVKADDKDWSLTYDAKGNKVATKEKA